MLLRLSRSFLRESPQQGICCGHVFPRPIKGGKLKNGLCLGWITLQPRFQNHLDHRIQRALLGKGESLFFQFGRCTMNVQQLLNPGRGG